jgi:hypothetical protein
LLPSNQSQNEQDNQNALLVIHQSDNKIKQIQDNHNDCFIEGHNTILEEQRETNGSIITKRKGKDHHGRTDQLINQDRNNL